MKKEDKWGLTVMLTIAMLILAIVYVNVHEGNETKRHAMSMGYEKRAMPGPTVERWVKPHEAEER